MSAFAVFFRGLSLKIDEKKERYISPTLIGIIFGRSSWTLKKKNFGHRTVPWQRQDMKTAFKSYVSGLI